MPSRENKKAERPIKAPSISCSIRVARIPIMRLVNNRTRIV
nr:MAG TPA_asm: hypothetical protein [Caudoviricetes sp.]